MKNIAIVIPFVFAFLFVTGMLVYLNTLYNNIFQFDFSPRLDNQSLAAADSLAIKDTVTVNNSQSESDTTLVDKTGLNGFQNNFNQKDQSITENKTDEKSNSEVNKNLVEKAKRDSAYSAWLKKTVKLVENLPPAQASKLLKNYSDNQARDIIYAMKQKKAAKIISFLESEYVHKLTRFE